MKKLRVAVMGCGRIAAVYKTALQNLSDQCQVVLAMDKDPAGARAFAAAFDGCEASALVSSAGFASGYNLTSSARIFSDVFLTIKKFYHFFYPLASTGAPFIFFA